MEGAHMTQQIFIRYPNSFYELATELKGALYRNIVCDGLGFIGAFQLETGIFYYWGFNWEGEPWEVRIEKDPYKVSDHTQTHSLWFRQVGTFKWILADFPELQNIEVVKDLEA